MKRKILILVFAAGLFVAGFSSIIYAQEKAYPNKLIQILVPHAPGTGIDLFNRLAAERLKNEWKVSVNVLNKTGAAGALAAEEVAKAKNDGYMLFSSWIAVLASMTAGNPKGPINVTRDFTPIAVNWGTAGDVLVVRSNSDFKALKDLADYVRKNPGKLICSTGAIGTDPYLGILVFKKQTRLDFVHLSLGSMAENVNAILGGHSHFANLSEAAAQPHIQAGTLRALATSIRSLTFPDIPTYVELGYQYDLIPSMGFWGPKGIPQEVIGVWEKAFLAMAKDPEFVASMRKVGHRTDLRTGADKLNAIMKEAVENYSRFYSRGTGVGTDKEIETSRQR